MSCHPCAASVRKELLRKPAHYMGLFSVVICLRGTTVDGLFMVNIGKVKAETRFFSWELFQAPSNYISLYHDIFYFYRLLEHQG